MANQNNYDYEDESQKKRKKNNPEELEDSGEKGGRASSGMHNEGEESTSQNFEDDDS